MLNKIEVIGLSASVIFMVLALFLIQNKTNLLGGSQSAQTSGNDVIIVGKEGNINSNRERALFEASDGKSSLNKLVIEDIKEGTGEPAKVGDIVTVHYVGTLQDGTEFDNSKKRGETFAFTIGEGRVIKGWEEGLVGMKVGGQRVLVIPPEKAYGSQSVGGVIPPNSTLIFVIDLFAIENNDSDS